MFDGDGVGDEVVAQYVAQALGGVFHPQPLLHQLALVPDRKADTRAHEGMAAHRLDAMGQLGGVGLQELAACRGAEEQLFHLYGGALCACRGAKFTGQCFEQEGAVLVRSPRQQHRISYRTDSG